MSFADDQKLIYITYGVNRSGFGYDRQPLHRTPLDLASATSMGRSCSYEYFEIVSLLTTYIVRHGKGGKPLPTDPDYVTHWLHEGF